VTTSVDFTARLWRADGALDRVLSGHGGEVNAASWSPDGKRLVTVSEDGTAQVWDAATGAPLVMLEHRSPVVCAAWSPDGERLATSSADGKVRVWRADGKGEPVVLDAQAPDLALMFLDGGKALLGVGANDVTYTWALDVGALRERLRAADKTCLPVDVRAIFLDESQEDAEERHKGCEMGQADHMPPIVDSGVSGGDKFRAPKGPKAAGAGPTAGQRRVDVLVIPGDAVVEVDGKRARRRDGVIEVLLQAGEEKLLKASAAGAVVPEKTVTIQDAAGKPVVVDLTEKPAAGKGAQKVTHFGFDE
jgi:dipeptidyl aminopeptidase/acylaminoacyl peptidase